MKTLPFTVLDLIKELDEMYPARCIAEDETPSQAHRYAGRRELIDELLARWQSTEKRALKDALLKE